MVEIYGDSQSRMCLAIFHHDRVRIYTVAVNLWPLWPEKLLAHLLNDERNLSAVTGMIDPEGMGESR